MLAVSLGRLVVLSTPFGQRGWFFDEWNRKGPWKKVRVTWHDCLRITADFIAEGSGRWVARGSPRNTNARSRRWRGLSMPTSPSASSICVRRSASRWAVSTGAGAIRSRPSGACSTKTTCSGFRTRSIAARRRCTSFARRCRRPKMGHIWDIQRFAATHGFHLVVERITASRAARASPRPWPRLKHYFPVGGWIFGGRGLSSAPRRRPPSMTPRPVQAFQPDVEV
jgi:hypothetical protein